jgi:hypothetical protein
MQYSDIFTKPTYKETPKMNWFNKKPYNVKNGFIVPKDENIHSKYNPFDLYENETEKRYSKSPHQIFANLDISNNKNIEDFYYNFGPLGFYNRDVIKLVTYNPIFANFKFPEGLPIAAVSRTPISVDYADFELLPLDDLTEKYHIPKEKFIKANTEDILLQIPDINSFDTWESIKDFKDAQKTFSWLMALNSNLERKSIEKLKELFVINNIDTGYEIKDASDKEILYTAANFIWFFINSELENKLSPLLVWDNVENKLSRSIVWRCESLLTSMYLMLLIDITKSKFNVKCSQCGNWFYAERSHGEYCSSNCKHSANKENSKYKTECLKKDKVLHLLKLGTSIIQISKSESIRKKTIEKWIKEEMEG